MRYAIAAYIPSRSHYLGAGGYEECSSSFASINTGDREEALRFLTERYMEEPSDMDEWEMTFFHDDSDEDPDYLFECECDQMKKEAIEAAKAGLKKKAEEEADRKAKEAEEKRIAALAAQEKAERALLEQLQSKYGVTHA